MAVGLILFGLFLLLESRTADPLVPLQLLKVRTLVAAMVLIFVFMGMLNPQYYLVTTDLQTVLGFDPLRAGLAFLPLSAASVIGSTRILPFLLRRFGPATTLSIGLLGSAQESAPDQQSGQSPQQQLDLHEQPEQSRTESEVSVCSAPARGPRRRSPGRSTSRPPGPARGATGTLPRSRRRGPAPGRQPHPTLVYLPTGSPDHSRLQAAAAPRGRPAPCSAGPQCPPDSSSISGLSSEREWAR
ncbi:MAG TPA: hypothetical protein VGX23_14410 [Actinocrinis sp.]|nr:hypothetical protein [Actinocrinis sp.]